MKPAQTTYPILWSGLMLSTATVPAWSWFDRAHVIILEVTESNVPPSAPTQSLLTITGKNFIPGGRLFLASTDITSSCPLDATHTVYSCTITPAITPGEYRLDVSGNFSFDVFDVTVPSPTAAPTTTGP